MCKRTEEEMALYSKEAYDRVWLTRKQDMFARIELGLEKVPPADIMLGCMKNIERVCEQYDIDFNEPISDWDYGYWSGILATLRWIDGCDKDDLDT